MPMKMTYCMLILRHNRMTIYSILNFLHASEEFFTDDDFCKKFGPTSGHADRTSAMIWIQAV